MNTYQMGYFLATVQYLSMTEAAEKLNITQPALSRSIAAMEAELGIRLFIRDKRKRLRLTPEGSEVYTSLRHIYNSYQAMLDQLDKISKGITGTLSVGLLEGQMMGEKLKNILDAFVERYPSIELILTRDEENGLVQKLYDGTLDVAVMLELQVHNNPELLFSELFWLPTYMIAAKGHPFAGRQNVPLAELRDDTFIYTKNSEITDQMRELCQKAGFEPRVLYANNIRDQQLYVELGRGIAGYNEYHACFYNPNVSTFTVSEIPDAQFSMVWHKDNFNPAIAMLNELADQL